MKCHVTLNDILKVIECNEKGKGPSKNDVTALGEGVVYLQYSIFDMIF